MFMNQARMPLLRNGGNIFFFRENQNFSQYHLILSNQHIFLHLTFYEKEENGLNNKGTSNKLILKI